MSEIRFDRDAAARAAPSFAEFPKEEFARRYSRLRVEMYRHGLEALLATNEPNFAI